MKRWGRLLLIIGFLCVLLLGVGTISARGPNDQKFVGLSSVGGTWDSGIKIQNLGSGTASVVPTFYSADDPSTFYTAAASSVAAGESVEYWLPVVSEVPSGKYSAVISSSEPIAVVSTHTNYSVGIADSYNGVSAGASPLYVPYVYRGLNDWVTEITVQNCDPSQEANVTLTVEGEGLGSPQTYGPVTIPPNGVHTWDTSTSEFSALGNTFKGSAIITSDGPDLAAEVNEIRVGGSTNVMNSFRALTSNDAASLLLAPSLYKNFGDVQKWRSGIQIQNIDPVNDANVTITFRHDPGNVPVTNAVKTVTIPPETAWQFYLPNDSLDTGGPLPDWFKGSATIESDTSVLAMVIHTNYPSDVANGYIAIPPSAGTSHLSTPSLYKNFGAGSYIWRSGIKVQNVSTTDPVTVSFTFSHDPGCVGEGTLSNVVIDPGAAFEFYLPNANLDTAVPLVDMYKGSAVVEVVGTGTIVGTVIHTNYGRGIATMYGAVNYTP